MQKILSNKNETVRLFENDILEALTHIHPAIPLIVYVPVILFFFSQSILQTTFMNTLIGFVIGLFCWTILEYLMHRIVFHYEPKSKIGKYLIFLFHGIHHAYPQDATRLVMPLPVSIPLALAFYKIFSLLFTSLFFAAFSGLVFGYLCYDMIHYATHHFKMKGKIPAYLKWYHLKHHYQEPNNGFGVSNPLWDYIFGTTYQKK